PRRLLREEHLSVLKLSGLYAHPDFLVMLGFDRNDGEIRRLEFLDKRRAKSGVCDQVLGGLMQLGQLSGLPPQGREVEPAAQQINEVVPVVANAQRGAYR